MLLLLFAGASGVTPPVGDGVAGPFGSTLHIEFSPTTRPFETPVWVDISEHVRFSPGVSTKRGRSSELDQFQSGSLSLVLDNRTRLFDPSYTAGTYYGQLKPMRRIRVVVEMASVLYPVFSGFIIGWPQEYDRADNVLVVPIEARDGFEILANTTAADNFLVLDDSNFGRLDFNRLGGDGVEVAEELSGSRVDVVLSVVGWLENERSVDTGLSLLANAAMTGSALQYLRRVEASEDGFFFIDRDGNATFRDRASRWTNTRMTSTQVTFSDDGSDVPYSQVATRFDRDFIINDVVRARDGGDEQYASDSDSIRDYGRRKDEQTDLLLSYDNEARSRAEYRLARFKDPLTRPEPVVVPATSAAVLTQVLDTELLDRAVLERRPLGGSVLEFTGLLQSIEHRFDTKAWAATFVLSPGDVDDAPYLVLDTGLLDTGVLGY